MRRLQKLTVEQLKSIFGAGKLIVRIKGFEIKSAEVEISVEKIAELKSVYKGAEVCDNLVMLDKKDLALVAELKLSTEIKIIG